MGDRGAEQCLHQFRDWLTETTFQYMRVCVYRIHKIRLHLFYLSEFMPQWIYIPYIWTSIHAGIYSYIPTLGSERGKIPDVYRTIRCTFDIPCAVNASCVCNNIAHTQANFRQVETQAPNVIACGEYQQLATVCCPLHLQVWPLPIYVSSHRHDMG